MRINMGTIDRVIRAVIGIVVIVVGVVYQSLWGLLGLIPLLTAAVGFCPLYVPLKISTTKKKAETKPRKKK